MRYPSPGRKVDPNPLFPLEQVRSVVFGREDPVEDDLAAISDEALAEDFVQINTPGDMLNLRRWPSFNPNVIAAIPDGAILPVLRSGVWSRAQVVDEAERRFARLMGAEYCLTTCNGTNAIISDRDFVSLTFKTTF